MILGNAFFIEHRAVLDFANSTVTMNRDGKFYKLVAAQTEQQFSGHPVGDDHVEINSDSPGLIDFDGSNADVIMTETEKNADESPAEIPAEPATAKPASAFHNAPKELSNLSCHMHKLSMPYITTVSHSLYRSLLVTSLPCKLLLQATLLLQVTVKSLLTSS